MATAADKGEESSAGGLYDQPLVLEGKRQRKSVESFSVEHEAKTISKYEGGKGTKLGDIPYTEHYLTRQTAVDLKPFHKLCFDRPGNKLEIKKNLREFSGFTFVKDSDQYKKKKTSLGKLQKAGLCEFLDILGLQRTGTKEDMIDRILDFLLEPEDTGKAPAAKRRRKSSSSSSKRKPSKSSGGTKKAKRASHTESSDEEDGHVSFDENDDDEDENDEEKDDEITAPTDDELSEAVTSILEGADLETVTNNSVCKQVFEKFPGVDLTTKKDYIKSCIQKALAASS